MTGAEWQTDDAHMLLLAPWRDDDAQPRGEPVPGTRTDHAPERPPCRAPGGRSPLRTEDAGGRAGGHGPVAGRGCPEEAAGRQELSL